MIQTKDPDSKDLVQERHYLFIMEFVYALCCTEAVTFHGTKCPVSTNWLRSLALHCLPVFCNATSHRENFDNSFWTCGKSKSCRIATLTGCDEFLWLFCRAQVESSGADSESEGDATEGNKSRLPVECLGRQEDSDVFVLGPSLQFWSNGEAIPPEQQQYVWIPYILKKLKVMDSISPIDKLPSVQNPMRKVVKGLRKISGDNFPSSILMLGEDFV